MDEQKAKAILGDAIGADESLYSLGWYLFWDKGNDEATLDGKFTLEELQAITWWIENKK